LEKDRPSGLPYEHSSIMRRKYRRCPALAALRGAPARPSRSPLNPQGSCRAVHHSGTLIAPSISPHSRIAAARATTPRTASLHTHGLSCSSPSTSAAEERCLRRPPPSLCLSAGHAREVTARCPRGAHNTHHASCKAPQRLSELCTRRSMLQGPPKRADPGGRAAEARARVSVYTRIRVEDGAAKCRHECRQPARCPRQGPGAAQLICGMFHSTSVRERCSRSAKRPEAVISAPAPGPCSTIGRGE